MLQTHDVKLYISNNLHNMYLHSIIISHAGNLTITMINNSKYEKVYLGDKMITNKATLIKECSECKLAQESKNGLCSVCITQKIIRGKWKIVVIWLLKDGEKRFSQLQRTIPDITQSYLTSQLRELEQAGLVEREVFNVIPPKVEYSLTKRGNSFLEVMEGMETWGQKYIKEILEKPVNN